MRARGVAGPFSDARGFSLIEVLVVVLLLAIAMLGVLAVFDASARINKSEQDVADAQGAVRYGVYQMTRAIRMAGSGGLFVTQAVLNAPDPQLAGINKGTGANYDNVVSATVTGNDAASTVHPVRDGTDMIEVRGVLNSPLLGFYLSGGCAPCTGTSALNVVTMMGCPTCTDAITTPAAGNAQLIGTHVNNNTINRPQFAQIDAYTAGASGAQPMLVIVTANDDIHGGCSVPFGPQQFAQPTYNVGRITAPTTLAAANTFGPVDFANSVVVEFNNENPKDAGVSATPIDNLRRGGILDDIVFFIDNTDPNHPALAQGIRRGAAFDVQTIADDVEDMQIAYGADSNGDFSVTRTAAAAGLDSDLNTSSVAGQDEWRPNVATEAPLTAIQFQSDPAPGTFPHPGNPAAAHCPRLHGVMISLLARSKDPDPTYNGPTEFGVLMMNAPALVATTTKYRRRVQTLRINLRNYSVDQ